MNVNEAKRELGNYLKYENTIETRRKWLEEKKLESNRLSPTLSDMPKGSRKENDTMAEKLSETLDIEADTEKYLKTLEEKNKAVYKKVLLIEQPYQDILFNLYILGNSIEITAEMIHYSKSHTDRLKKKAIEMYAEIISQ